MLACVWSTPAGVCRLVLSSRLSPSRGRPLSGVDLELPSPQGSRLRQLWCEVFDPSLSPVLVESFAPGKGLMYPFTRSPILLACTVALGQLGYLTLQGLVDFRGFSFRSWGLLGLTLFLPALLPNAFLPGGGHMAPPIISSSIHRTGLILGSY